MHHDHIEMTFFTVMIILGSVQLLAATIKIPDRKYWGWLAGGLLFLAVGLLFL